MAGRRRTENATARARLSAAPPARRSAPASSATRSRDWPTGGAALVELCKRDLALLGAVGQILGPSQHLLPLSCRTDSTP